MFTKSFLTILFLLQLIFTQAKDKVTGFLLVPPPTPNSLNNFMKFEYGGNFRLINNTSDNLNVYIIPTLKGERGALITLMNYKSSNPITLRPGVNDFNVADMKTHFRNLTSDKYIIQHLNREEVINQDALPNGTYSLKYSIFDYNTFVNLGLIGSNTFKINTSDQLSITYKAKPSNLRIQTLDISVAPLSDKLVSLKLTFYDSGIRGGNAETILYDGRSVSPKFLGGKVSILTVNGKKYYNCSLSFPPWTVGKNTLKVTASLQKADGSVSDLYKEASVSYSQISPGLGLFKNANGVFYRLKDIPIFSGFGQSSFGQRNTFNLIKDADQDGLSDAWENIALFSTKPSLMFDSDEDLFEKKNVDAGHQVMLFTRVSAIESKSLGNKKFIRFCNVMTFSKDYGDPGQIRGPIPVLEAVASGFGDHHGDTQKFNSYWEVIDDFTIHLVYIDTEGHIGGGRIPTGINCSGSSLEFLENGIPKIFIEEDKHGLWCNLADNHARGSYYTNAQKHKYNYKAFNVGEPVGYGRYFLDALTMSGDPLKGPYKDAFNVFNSEFVWTRSDKGFCGGLGPDPDRECAGALKGFFTSPPVAENFPNEGSMIHVDFKVISDNDTRLIEMTEPIDVSLNLGGVQDRKDFKRAN